MPVKTSDIARRHLAGGSAPATPDARPRLNMLLGEAISPGLALGRALLCECAVEPAVPVRCVSEEEARQELARFDRAVDAVAAALTETEAAIQRTLGASKAEIFGAQLLMLREPKLRNLVAEICLGERLNAEAAVERAVRQLAEIFDRLPSPYLRERAVDVREVGRRLLAQLLGVASQPIAGAVEECVLVTNELFSASVAQLEGRGVRALILECGAPTAHATILARALGIPVLARVAEARQKIRPGDLLIVDALAGRAFIEPPREVLEQYQHLERNLRAHEAALEGTIDSPTVTRDGEKITLSANIGQTADAAAAGRVKPDGAGLYRTEFLFLVQDHFPSEEEQYRFYRASAEHLHPERTVIRLLDIGSDKPLDYFPLPTEPNPALGCRGTQLLLAHPDILRTQLRAILRVSGAARVAVLLPMIRDADEVRAIKTVIEEIKAELAAEGTPFDADLPLGAMIETPAATLLIDQLAEEVSFFSVGTNDLVQYLLAADRAGAGADSPYDPLHPAVVRVLASLVKNAAAVGKPISVCGEIASDPAYTAVLLGLGFRSLSVPPRRLLEIKEAIRSIGLSEATELARKLLASSRDGRAAVEEEWTRRRPVQPPEFAFSKP